MLASMVANLVPSFLDLTPSGPDRTHALAVQALMQDREDRAFIGDVSEMTERRRERLRVMQQRREAEVEVEKERERRRKAIERATASSKAVEGRAGGRSPSLAAAVPPSVPSSADEQQQQPALV